MRDRPSHRRPAKKAAFTLLEVMLVMVILVILASLTGVYIRKTQQTALIDATRAQIGLFEDALKMYEIHVRNFPTTAQGLDALINMPSGLANESRWRGPYLERKQVPLDPWDHPYRYELAEGSQPVITSAGADGVDGSDDDIRNE